MLGRTWVGEVVTCLSSGKHSIKNAIRKVFPREKPNSGTRVLVGDVGWKEIQDAKETGTELENELDEGGLEGGTESGVNVTSI